MFAANRKILFLVLTLLVVAGPSNVLGQHRMSGRIGADIGTYNFENTVKVDPDEPENEGRDTKDISSDRRLSSQSLDLDFSGPFVDGFFAHYLATMKLSGVQVRAVTEDVATTDYLNPDLTHYYGSVSLFHNRKYPFRFYTGKSDDHTVRYEAANRPQTEILDAGLAVVRRYQKIVDGTGAIWQYYPNEGVEFASEYKTTRNQTLRQYDFDENRNIWVDYSNVRLGTGPFFDVKIQNTIEDREVRVFIDGFDVGIVPADGELDLQVGIGRHDLVFVPDGLNEFRDDITVVEHDMIWKIFFSIPPGAKDLDNNNNVFNARLRLGNDEKFKNETFFEYDDGYEAVDRNDTDLLVFFNDASYEFSPTTKLQLKTDYTDNTKDIEDRSYQKTKNFKHETVGTWQTRKGPGARLSHSFNKTDAVNDDTQVVSEKNIINGIYSHPTNWKDHRVSVGANLDFLTDSDGNKNDTYTTSLHNELAFRTLGLRWKPKHDVKSVVGTRNQPYSKSKELSSRFVVEGLRAQLGPVGKFAVKGIHDWRRQRAGISQDITTKYITDVSVTKNFNRRYRVGGGLSLETETFNTTLETVAGEVPPDIDQREAQHTRAVNFNASVEPWDGYSASVSARFVKTNDANNRNITALISFIIPGIGIPVSTFVTSENRELEGLDAQTNLQVESKLIYKFRKIKLTASYMRVHEKLTTEDYNYTELRANISRNFDIY